MRLYSSISVLDDEQKLELKGSIRHYLIRAEFDRIQRRQIVGRTIIWVGPFLFIPTFAFLAISSPQTCGLVALQINLPSYIQVPDCQFSNTILAYAVFALLYLLTVVPQFLGSSRSRFRWLTRVVRVLVLALTAALLLMLLSRQQILRVPIKADLAMSEISSFLFTASGALVVLYLFMLLTVTIINQTMKRVGMVSNPDAVIVDGLVATLVSACYRPKWHDTASRRRIMNTLEIVAVSMEKDMPRALRSGDEYTDFWLQDTWRCKAAAIRSLKQWLGTPRRDTQEQLANELAVILRHAATNDWHALESMEPRALDRPQRIARIMALIKGLLVGTGPILLLLLLNETPLAVTGTLGDYLKIGAIIWALITYISLLDPAYGIKLTALREAVDLLRNR